MTKAEKPKREKAERVKPKSTREQVETDMADFLKASAETRTASLKIAGLAYTEELEKTLVKHAAKMEKSYSDIKKSLGSKLDEKTLQGFIKRMDEELKTAKKLQAFVFHFLTQINHAPTMVKKQIKEWKVQVTISQVT